MRPTIILDDRTLELMAELKAMLPPSRADVIRRVLETERFLSQRHDQYLSLSRDMAMAYALPPTDRPTAANDLRQAVAELRVKLESEPQVATDSPAKVRERVDANIATTVASLPNESRAIFLALMITCFQSSSYDAIKLTAETATGLVFHSLGVGVAEEVASERPQMIVTGDQLRLRPTPDLKSDVIRRLARGTVVTVLETRPGWALVLLADSGTGWVSADYLDPI